MTCFKRKMLSQRAILIFLNTSLGKYNNDILENWVKTI